MTMAEMRTALLRKLAECERAWARCVRAGVGAPALAAEVQRLRALLGIGGGS